MRLSSVLSSLAAAVALAGCGDAPSSRETAAYVRHVAFDPEVGSPVVVLHEEDGSRELPIWIGVNEARSIAARLGGETPPRPNTHDLTKRLVDRMAGKIRRVVVTDLSEGVYFARIHLTGGEGERFEVDARPSDAIALALRFGAPIFVHEGLLGPRIELRPDDAADRQVPELRL